MAWQRSRGVKLDAREQTTNREAISNRVSRLLDATPEESPPSHLLGDLLAKIAIEKGAQDPYAELPLPADLRATFPRLETPLAFGSPKRWTNDSRVACLLTDPRAQAQLFLLEVPAGERIPQHKHLGHEHALCLAALSA